MDHTVIERFARIREMASRVEAAAATGRWDSALAGAIMLNGDAAFIKDWLRGQSEYRAVPAAVGDTWEPPAEPPLENVSEPLSGTLDADLPVPR